MGSILLDIVIMTARVIICLFFAIYIVAFVVSELYKKGIKWTK